jgi:hypothetical protein
METKYCKVCCDFKPIEEFYKSQNTLICKFHYKLRNNKIKKIYRQNPKNIEKEKVKSQERRLRLWANHLINISKSRKYEHTLTVDEILEMYQKQNGLCYWYKVPLIQSLTKKHPQQPSLDRLDRTKGYTKDNVVLACYAANMGRNDTDTEVWKNFILLLINKEQPSNRMDYDITSLKEKLKEVDDRDEFVIYDENLNQTIVKNLNEFATSNGISVNTIRSIRKKTKRNTQKGLIILNRSKNESIEKRVYVLTDPNGIIYKLTSLRDFCIKNNLNDSVLQRVGKGELKQYKGWSCKYEIIKLE